MVPYTKDESDALKHSLKQVGKKYVFTIKKLASDDAGLYSVDVEGVNVFSTEFKGRFPIEWLRIQTEMRCIDSTSFSVYAPVFL